MPAKSQRGRQNYYYAALAIKALLPSYEQGLNHLFKPEPKWTILAALGRIKDSSNMLVAAQWICERGLTSRQAVAFARAVNGRKPADPLKLSHAIQRTIEKYRARHPDPGLSNADVWEVLRDVANKHYFPSLGS
jgi:hypothetical protein